MQTNQESDDVRLKREELTPGIFIEHFQKTTGDKSTYTMKVESHVLKIMDLVIDLKDSKSIDVQGASDKILKVKVEPFMKAIVAQISLSKKWLINPKFTFKLSTPNIEVQKLFTQPDIKDLEEKIKKFNEISHIDFKIFPIDDCLRFLEKKKTNFIDLEFPPTAEKLCPDIQQFENRYKTIPHWRRAKFLYYPFQKANQNVACPPTIFSHEFSRSVLKSIQKSSSSKFISNRDLKNPSIMSNNFLDLEYLETEKHNIAFLSNEGLDPGIGNHDWLTVAFMAIKNHPDLLKHIFLTCKPNVQGFYLLKLHVMGRKSIMQLDDYIPCSPFEGPLFMGRGTEIKPDFGFLLLEKAFAKKRGSYHNLKNGSISTCLVDLTGSPVFEFEMKDIPESAADKLWRQIESWISERFIIILEQTINDERIRTRSSKHYQDNDNKNNFYVITSIEIDENNSKIVKLNMKPQTSIKIESETENQSKDVQSEKRGLLEPIDLIGIDLSPNELPIPFSSLFKNFQKIILAKTNYKEKLRVKGKFVTKSTQSKTSIPVQNLISRWYYLLEVKEKTNLTIGLHQEDEDWVGVKETRPNIDIGYGVFVKINEEFSLVHYLPPNIKREVFSEIELEAGTCIVIPLTLGIFNKGDSLKQGIISHDKTNPVVVSVVKDIFEKLNMSGNDFLAYSELKNFYKTLNLKGLSQEEYQNIIGKYSSGKDLNLPNPEGLSEKAFVELFFDLLEDQKNNKVDGQANFFNLLGYDDTLFSVSSRIFTLTVHSNKFVDIDWKDALKDNIEEKVYGLILDKHGKKIATFREEEEQSYPLVLANEFNN
jgi:hypothetical protein